MLKKLLNGFAISLIRWLLMGGLVMGLLWMAGLMAGDTWSIWKVAGIGLLIDVFDWLWPHLRSRPRWF